MSSAPQKCNVGGQAVIEGVMMRSPASFAVACRRPGGEIVVREERWRALTARLRPLRWPFLRGAVVLLESLLNGMSALSFSAKQQEEASGHEGAPDGARTAASTAPAATAASTASAATAASTAAAAPGASSAPAAPDVRAPRAPREPSFTGMLIVSVLAALLVFKGLPHLLTWLLGLKTSSISFHLVDGGFKVLLLVGYIASIGLMKDIRRVFMYHGAEHKAIWAHEKGLELTVENVRRESRFHPRCGTSFLVLVILISVFIFALLLRYPISQVALVDNLVKILIKVPLMFPVAGLSYEAIKLSARFRESPIVRALVAPGLWLQRLTTREPTDDQLEVSLVALQKTLWRERATSEVGEVGEGGVEVFATYAEALPSLKGGEPAAA